MSDKIKRLAKNISELVPVGEEMQDTYEHLTDLMKKQKEYFGNFPPENIVKLLIYLWSYQKTGGFEHGDDLLNRVAFAIVFETQGESHTETCEECGGYGDVDCMECSGTGYVECDECDGSGDVDCTECGGAGDINDDGESITCPDCNGSGEESCGNCGGDGNINCGNCTGSGKEECGRCDGRGDYETDETDYIRYFIMTWSEFIKQRCELTEDNSDITMSEYDFDRLRDRYVKLFSEESHAELMDFVEPNEIYCVMYDDSPRMIINTDMKLRPHNFNLNSFTKR